jgi:1-acyl-sn-glycerol-3-phosphate acyltransferase
MNDEWARSTRVRRIAHWLLHYSYTLIWGCTVEGLEHLPAEGGIIIAGAPHTSYFDIVMAIGAGPKRVLLGVTKAEAFKTPFVGWFLRKAGAIPLDRKSGAAGLRAAIEALAAGGCIGIFPEGTRSKTGELGRAKAGMGYLASRSGALVVPVRLIGMFGFPWTRKIGVRFGPALRFDDPAADSAACQAFAQSVLERAFSL